MHYFGSMVLLGVGWNFLFLGGTTLLTQSYRMSERFKVQATNDFMIFGLQAVGSLGGYAWQHWLERRFGLQSAPATGANSCAYLRQKHLGAPVLAPYMG